MASPTENQAELTQDELWVLSYYRVSELAGALLFGKLALRTSDPQLAVYLTEHAAEEARHAWLWTETIRALGHWPIPITQTYQSQYARESGIPCTMVEVLLLTEVFEERIYKHFTLHARRANVHPAVRRTLGIMLEDERGHLGWVRNKLDQYERDGMDNIRGLRRRYQEMDDRIYRATVGHEERLWEFLGMRP
jgi:rubrerythrin